MAEETVIHASSLENSLDDNAIAVLQKLRDDYMMISLEEFAVLMASSGMGKIRNDEDVIDEEGEPNGAIPLNFVDGVSSPRLGEAGRVFGSTGAIVTAGGPHAHSPEPKEFFSGNVQTVPHVPNFQQVRRVRCNVSLDGPIRLEGLNSAAQIVSALDYIFRVYVRGNSLPGQQFGSGDVFMGDNKISMGKFLLQGPYMSWKGFLEFVKDFRIAQLPSKRTKIGVKFYQAWDVNNKLYDECNFLLADAPVTMRDLAIIFVECSKTCTPALVLSKYLKSHYEDVFKRMGQGGAAASNFAPGSGMDRKVSSLPVVGSFMGEPWDDILKWLDESDDWNIVNGLNFVQFIDCVAKCGILAYSMEKFDDALPNPVDKVEHFLAAHMKVLGDNGGGAWKIKVDARLKEKKDRIKASIAESKAQAELPKSPRKGEKSPRKGEKSSPRRSDRPK